MARGVPIAEPPRMTPGTAELRRPAPPRRPPITASRIAGSMARTSRRRTTLCCLPQALHTRRYGVAPARGRCSKPPRAHRAAPAGCAPNLNLPRSVVSRVIEDHQRLRLGERLMTRVIKATSHGKYASRSPEYQPFPGRAPRRDPASVSATASVLVSAELEGRVGATSPRGHTPRSRP